MKARKEITVAIFIGLTIGLIVFGGILRARTAIVNKAESSPSPSPLASGAKQVNPRLPLTLETKDNQVVSVPNLTIVGKTSPEAYIIILGEKSEHIIVPSELGNFSQEIDLTTGANTIIIKAYLEDGTLTESVLTAVYTTAEI